MMNKILSLLSSEKLKGQLGNLRQLFGKKILLVLIWIKGILYYSNSPTLQSIQTKPSLPVLFTIVVAIGIMGHAIADAGSKGATSFQNIDKKGQK